MPEHLDPLHHLCDLTRKCCTFLRGLFRSFREGHSAIETADKITLSKFVAEGEIFSSLMAHPGPIDILSSDSESEIEVCVENGTSLAMESAVTGIPRKLPSWASTASTQSNGRVSTFWIHKTASCFIVMAYSSIMLLRECAGYIGSSRNHQLPQRASSSVEWHSNHNHSSQVKLQKHPSSTYRDHMTFADRPVNDFHVEDVDGSVSSHHKDISGNIFGKFSSQQYLKRCLPQSLQSPASTSKAKSSMENGALSKSYLPFASNIIDPKVYPKDNLGGKANDVSSRYDHTGGRLLPSSLAHGKLLPNVQSAGSSAPAHLSGIEERPAENDERLVFQAALQITCSLCNTIWGICLPFVNMELIPGLGFLVVAVNLSQPKYEVTLPDGLLAVPLLKHQKIALAWLCLKETNSVHCLGGILADDQTHYTATFQGLGKTVSMIALILMQRHLQLRSTADEVQTFKSEALNLDDEDDDAIPELEKVRHTDDSVEVKTITKVRVPMPVFHKGRPAAVLVYHGSTRTKDPVELAKYDVVLTTYAIVANEVPKQPLADDDDDEDKKDGDKYGLSSEFSNNKKRKTASNAKKGKKASNAKKGKKGRKGLDGSSIYCGSGTLAKVGWLRVILDEAQTIKNHRTQVARACCGLRAKRRWCLSGTPIQNSIDDLFSYFRFLKYDPYAVFGTFCIGIKLPISRNASHGYKKLQAVLKTIMLRRTKGTLLDGEPIINIPPKSILLMKVDFSIEERDFYNKLEADSRSQFKEYAAAGTLNQNYANILLMLLRLRQACDHPLLVKGHDCDSVGKASIEMARRLPRDMLINLLNRFEDPICDSCSDPPDQAVVTMCGHVFCYQCVSDHLTGDDNMCPAHECKEQLGTDVVFAKATLRNCISGEWHDDITCLSEVVDNSLALQNMYTSSKIRAALEILERYCKPKNLSNGRYGSEGHRGNSCSSETKYLECSSSDVCGAIVTAQLEKPDKAIVFSQWTGMLDLVETSLNHSCIQYRRFDGTMSLASRDKAVKDFNNDPEVTVMLMSLKAGNLGLNMVAACRVILLDLWWNPTTEDQAVDRAHRIGQTRPVTVSRLTIKDTVEDRILSLQEEKRKMVASAFGEDQTGGSATRLTVEDLRYLFMV
ncbi:hypothetical protein IFM89_007686 [Coptis chinensis]|uniref:Helicase-like transcription factor CHR28 n=1 Tax=Coptis chinensis TaxID=261450 RepID=A0A835IVI4_9MAGN|nr:hypothetical protein IFM89_007686 [Coptis chinensis]